LVARVLFLQVKVDSQFARWSRTRRENQNVTHQVFQ
jgi:hypothetical protein